MKLRQTPGGTWCGTEADYKKAMKAEGKDIKSYAGRVFVEVPTDKYGLMEFLTFHNVNVINPGPSEVAGGGLGLPPVPAVAGNTHKATPSNPELQPRALVTLAQMDEPETNRIVELVARSSGYPLVRFATAVAIAFKALADGKTEA